MKITCLTCGATNSLDSLLAHGDAGDAVRAALNMLPDGLGDHLLRYCGLWRSQGRALAWSRVAKILNELSPDIQRQEITRQSHNYAAPPDAWITAIDLALKAERDGTLLTPLNSHGWLYKVISSLKPELYQSGAVSSSPTPKRAMKIVLSPAQQKMEEETSRRLQAMRDERNNTQNNIEE